MIKVCGDDDDPENVDKKPAEFAYLWTRRGPTLPSGLS